jgi:hypothetical protein
VGLVGTYVLKECVTSISRVERISDLGIALAATSRRNTNYMRKESITVGYVRDGWRRRGGLGCVERTVSR